MFKTIITIAALVLVIFLVVGSIQNKGVKDNYGKPMGKVMEHVAKDISTGADVTTKKVSEKVKDITKE